MTPIILSLLLSGPVQANHIYTDDIVSWDRTPTTTPPKLFEPVELKRWPVLAPEQIPRLQNMLDKLKEMNGPMNSESIKFLELMLKETKKEEKKNQSKK